MIMFSPFRISLVALLSLSLTSTIVAIQAFELPPPISSSQLLVSSKGGGDDRQQHPRHQQHQQQQRRRFFSNALLNRTPLHHPLRQSTWSLSSSSLDDIPRGGGGGGGAGKQDETVSGGTASIPTEVFNLVKSIAGAGVLSLPAGMFMNIFISLQCRNLTHISMCTAYCHPTT
jgi:hypothetical protein